MTAAPPFVTALLALVVVTACAEPGDPGGHRLDPSTRGPTVVATDSVVLQEPDSASIGAYSSFVARSARGEVIVNDIQQARLFQFSHDGRLVRIIGARGEGPGEFTLPGVIHVLPDDTTLVVIDVNARRGSLFSLVSGNFLGQFSTTFPDVGAEWTLARDTVFMAVNAAPSLLAVWPSGTDSATTAGTLPPDLLTTISDRISYGRSEVVVDDSLVLALIPTRPGLDVYTRQFRYRGLVPLAAVRRKGEPASLREAARALGRNDDQSLASSVVGLHRVSSGALVAAHLDMTVRRMGEANYQPDNFVLYVSLISADLHRACIDGIVPMRTDVAPIPVFRGDTMFVLTRRVESDDKVRSVMRAFVIDPADCDWVPTGGITEFDAVTPPPSL